MSKKVFALFFVALIVLPVLFFGCKGKVEKTPDYQLSETQQMPQMTDTLVTTEPAQTIAMTEAIPPTAAPQLAPQPQSPRVDSGINSRDIQMALKNAGFYAGAIDGKVGPKTKSAILEFQKAKGLKVDGKVGPKTWAELEKYLIQTQ